MIFGKIWEKQEKRKISLNKLSITYKKTFISFMYNRPNIYFNYFYHKYRAY